MAQYHISQPEYVLHNYKYFLRDGVRSVGVCVSGCVCVYLDVCVCVFVCGVPPLPLALHQKDGTTKYHYSTEV